MKSKELKAFGKGEICNLQKFKPTFFFGFSKMGPSSHLTLISKKLAVRFCPISSQAGGYAL
jgi:hypothetical protein